MGETKKHKYLKKIGMAILMNKGCNPVGIEIPLPIYIRNGFESEFWKNFLDDNNRHHITDVAGLVGHSIPTDDPLYTTKTVKTIYAIEVKVSRSDFRSGFCRRGWGKMWLIAPPGIIPLDELPRGIGLYECDTEKRTLKLVKKASFSGMETDDYTHKGTSNAILWSGYIQGIKETFIHNPEIKDFFTGVGTHFWVKAKE